VWNEFCDWYLESAKPALYAPAGASSPTLQVFDYCLGTFLRLLHPFMPFVTDELYHQMGFTTEDSSIMLATWPQPLATDKLAALGATPETVALNEGKFELIRAVRNLRASYQIATSQPIALTITPSSDEAKAFLTNDLTALKALLNASSLELGDKPAGPCGVAVSGLATAYVSLAGIVDFAAELARLEKQAAEAVKYLESVRKKLSNENFVSRAPAEVVEKERAHITEFEEKIARIREQKAMFQN
jgi:valyl-tRNA synthetase